MRCTVLLTSYFLLPCFLCDFSCPTPPGTETPGWHAPRHPVPCHPDTTREKGWDVIVSHESDNDKTPTGDFHKLRTNVAGYIIKWCMTIDQKICFICFEDLYPAATIVSLKSTVTQMHTGSSTSITAWHAGNPPTTNRHSAGSRAWERTVSVVV